MYTYQRFRIGETDHFEETKYLQINTALQAIVMQMSEAAGTPVSAMLLSFVKDHCISSKSVAAFPALANMISTKELPLGALEELFEASKHNSTFQKELQIHIETYLNKHNKTFSPSKPSI